MDGELGRYLQLVQGELSRRFDPHVLTYDSFFGVGFESFAVGVAAALTFGLAVGLYPLIPLVPEVNLLLFVAFGVSITGSTHYDPKLGVMTSSLLLATARVVQMLTGSAPASLEFLGLALLWGAVQVFLIGFLPGKLISTCEHPGLLAKGLAGIAVLYGSAEYFMGSKAAAFGISSQAMLTFPIASFFLLVLLSSAVAFLFANTACPYMMMPLMSRSKEARYCGSRNYIYDMGAPVEIDEETIQRIKKRGFKLVSNLPAVAVFTCSRGGIISAYRSGKILIRKVNKATADRIERNLAALLHPSQ